MFIPHPKWICLLLLLLVAAVPAQSQDITPSSAPASRLDGLVVAWVDSGDLFVRAGEAAPKLPESGAVVRPYLAPDGKHVAFTRGQGSIANTLWVVAIDGQSARELVTARDLASSEGEPTLIGQVNWLDNSSLYFNTARLQSLGLQRQDDLWRANIETGEVILLLSSGEGGAFSISPDRQHIAIIEPGLYSETDGQIRLLDTQTQELRVSFSFAAVSTGAEYRFYPEVFWEEDSSAVRVALPDKDLIYDDVKSAAVILWRLDIDGLNQQIGSATASFFGLPRWSSDGSYMTYLRRVGAATSNQFDLIIAAGNGENATQYTTGEAGTFGAPTWIPASIQFMYPQGQPNSYWLGSPGIPPRQLIQPMVNPQFVDRTGIVYADRSTSAIELRYINLDDLVSTLIAAVSGSEALFDAIRVK